MRPRRPISQMKRRKRPSEPETVECKFCHKQVPVVTAHRHQEEWVGDECCWDERLRVSE